MSGRKLILMHEDMLNAIRDEAHWLGITQAQMIRYALREYFAGRYPLGDVHMKQGGPRFIVRDDDKRGRRRRVYTRRRP